MRRRRSQPKPLSDLVLKVYPSKEPDDVRSLRAFALWEKAVPERVAANARPVKLQRGVLYVHAATTVWANELDLLREELARRLQRVAPSAGIRSIRIRVGKLPPRPDRPRAPAAVPRPVPVTRLPEDLARALATIHDDELRATLGRAAATSLGRSDNNSQQ